MDQPTLFELDSRFRALVRQRNTALDECVLLAGEVEKLRSDVAVLSKELTDARTPADAAPASDPVARDNPDQAPE